MAKLVDLKGEIVLSYDPDHEIVDVHPAIDTEYTATWEIINKYDRAFRIRSISENRKGNWVISVSQMYQANPNEQVWRLFRFWPIPVMAFNEN